MKAEITIEVAIPCTVTGSWVAADPSVGQMEGYWEDVKFSAGVGGLFDMLEMNDDLVKEAHEALDRAAQSELETAQEP